MSFINMRNARLKIFALIFFCQFLFATQTLANEMRIAVASNFFSTMKEIISEFELENLESSKAIKIVLFQGLQANIMLKLLMARL